MPTRPDPEHTSDEFSSDESSRREFLKRGAHLAAAGAALPALALTDSTAEGLSATIDFAGKDSLSLPAVWETLNPGYWQIKGGALRRRLRNIGDRARKTGFPFHYESKGSVMETQYDPSLPAGIVYHGDRPLSGPYRVTVNFTYRGDREAPGTDDDPHWQMFQEGYGRMGIAFGAKSLFEGYQSIRHAVQAVWSDDGNFRWVAPRRNRRRGAAPPQETAVDTHSPLRLAEGDTVEMQLDVTPSGGQSRVVWTAIHQGVVVSKQTRQMPTSQTEGYFGIAARGMIDFEVNSVKIDAPEAAAEQSGSVECYACYPLGDTLRQDRLGRWQVKFVSLLAHDGDRVEIRVSESAEPPGGWESVAVAGAGKIINNDFRRNTAVINATLPVSPSDATLYYTVWKDGRDVTGDGRLGTSATGPGTGLVGDVPTSGGYVGRLPQLTAPYKLCGLSCHAITSGLQVETESGFRMQGGGDVWQFRDQPTEGAYRHLEDYDFQVMLWEDDVWYMELVLYPPSTDDAYRIITQSICGPASRWQLMRHWNVINPGDHDYGMDDVKGPEQIIIRRVEGLGQDTSYMRRNFQIVHHLITGAEQVDPLANPKKWRAWKMPQRDFTLLVLDSRLWRSSQDTDIWDDAGWQAFKSLYDRTDPTRSLLGEEQFAWLDEQLATDSSPLICLTGINGLHTIWTGGAGKFESGEHPQKFSQRDRVTADYAGWVKAGADRVLELLGSRDGVVTVYGDVHNGCLMTNQEQRVVECSFGPIGRSGGRGVIPGFGPKMKDIDGRDLAIHALYHKSYATPDLSGHDDSDPYYWNFLEMEFDPRGADAKIGCRIRNLIDSPQSEPRGGGVIETFASSTGRPPTSRLPAFRTLPSADILFLTAEGQPIRGTRSDADGNVPSHGLIGPAQDEAILVVAYDDERSASKILRSIAPSEAG